MKWDQIEAKWTEMTLRIRPDFLEGSRNVHRTLPPVDRATPQVAPSDMANNDGKSLPNQ